FRLRLHVHFRIIGFVVIGLDAGSRGENSHRPHFGQNRPSLPICRWVAIAKFTNMAAEPTVAAGGAPGSRPAPPRGKEADAGLSRAAPGEPGAGRLPHGEVRPCKASPLLLGSAPHSK